MGSAIDANPFYILDAADVSGSTALAGYSGLAMTVGGVACNQDGMRVLLTNQADPTENGPIVVRSGAWEASYPNSASAIPMMLVVGGFNAGLWWPDVTDWSSGASTWRTRKLTPPGSIVATGAAAAPPGWLLCDGSAVSRATYPALFAAVGTVFGPGDGSTTFNLPDLRQRFPLGKAAAGTGSTLGAVGGSIDHVHGSPLATGAPSDVVLVSAGAVAAAGPSHTHDLAVPADNPPFQVVNYVIKV